MKIRLISDVHFEFYEDKDLFENKGEDVLVIAGDLAVGGLSIVHALSRFAKNTKEVVYVPGNHEYYRGNIPEVDAYVRNATRNTNVHFLNPGNVRIDGVAFIGATLWTEFSKNQFSRLVAAQQISDFRAIRGFDTDYCVRLYNEHFKYIKEAYELLEGKKVIVTHFLPDKICIAPKFVGESAINDYFSNNLGNWIQDLQDVPYWLFGHTHEIVNKQINNTKVIANPYGYNKNSNYNELILEV